MAPVEYMIHPGQGLGIPEVLARAQSQIPSFLSSAVLPVTGMEIHKAHKHIKNGHSVGCVNTWKYVNEGVF